jgi:hypothetical protein
VRDHLGELVLELVVGKRDGFRPGLFQLVD